MTQNKTISSRRELDPIQNININHVRGVYVLKFVVSRTQTKSHNDACVAVCCSVLQCSVLQRVVNVSHSSAGTHHQSQRDSDLFSTKVWQWGGAQRLTLYFVIIRCISVETHEPTSNKHDECRTQRLSLTMRRGATSNSLTSAVCCSVLQCVALYRELERDSNFRPRMETL